MVHNHDNQSISRIYFEEEGDKDDAVIKDKTKTASSVISRENHYDEPRLLSARQKESESTGDSEKLSGKETKSPGVGKRGDTLRYLTYNIMAY